MRALTLALILAMGGCAGFPQEADYVLFEPDPNRGGLGRSGPAGVACAERTIPARVWDAIDVTVCWPAKADGTLAEDGPFNAAVFLHGGLVEPLRYRWLIAHMASRGYVVIAPAHKGLLALTEEANASAALDWLEEAAEAEGLLKGSLDLGNGAAVIGHSLGAVVAAMRWVADERFGGLVMLAGFPAEGTDLESRRGTPSLSIGGQRDLMSTPQEVKEGFSKLPEPRWLGMVTGMHHFAWSDGNTASNLDGDGVPTRPLEDLRSDALLLLDAFLDTHFKGSSKAYKALSGGMFPGVEVSQ